jgi:peptidoglycan/LPS O-acetylase OafA/YrhL
MLNRAFYPQLDSLRAFAILLVLLFHWFPKDSFVNMLPNGSMGVTLFFVISGFLISKILLENRVKIEQNRSTLSSAYLNFVIRRALRIFPLYYLFLTVIFIFFPHLSDIQAQPLYYYGYGYNFLLDKTGNWTDILSPFWTLAVEEQFYLLWPLVLLLTPTRYTFEVVLGFILLGPLTRLFDTNGLLTPSCFDCFGLGSLWAYCLVLVPERAPIFVRILNWAVWAAIPVFLWSVFSLEPGPWFKALFFRLSMSVVFLYCLVQTTRGIEQPVLRVIFDSSLLRYIGKVSYGLYVYHMAVPVLLTPPIVTWLAKLGIPLTSHLFFTLMSFVLLVGLATASWYIFEKPLNDLKSRFEYR